jgi:DNA polymerase-4
MSRTIVHLDLDAFFCAVEEQRDPALIGRAFAVGGQPDERGVVSTCSYAARRFGVRSAMPMSRAVRLCPGLLIVSPRFKAYREASREVMRRLRARTELVEQISIDEAFLDVTALDVSGEAFARALQAEIRDELGLPCSLGVAGNKLVAKIATDTGKAAARAAEQRDGPPNAVLVVPPGHEAEFLDPLPAEALWGVGPKTAARLAELGMRTIGDIARWPADDLARRFGKHGVELARRARGIDTRPVVTSHPVKSVSQEVTFARDVRDGERLRQTLTTQAERVGRSLRREGLAGTTVKLKLRWPDFTTLTRQTTLPAPTNQDATITATALQLFEGVWRAGRAVRLIGVGVSGLLDAPVQLSLWDALESERDRRLRETLDGLQARFGKPVVRSGDEMWDEDQDA